MKIKKPILKIIQIGTLFICTSLSFLGVISFSHPEISSFWVVKKLHFNISNISFAESDDKNKNKSKEKDNDDNDNDDDDDEDDHNSYTPPVITVPTVPTNPTTPTQPVVPPTTPNTGCQTITETIYDTVTSASGTKTQVPRKVTREVCNTTPTQPVVTVPINPVVPTPTTPVVPTQPVVTLPSLPVTVPVSSLYNNGTYTGVGKYSFPGGSIDYTVEIIISGEKISNARFISFTPSGNGLYTRAQGDSILSKIVSSQNSSIDTFTGASGTSKAIQDAVDNALGKAKKTTPVVTNPTTPVIQPVTPTPVITNPTTPTTPVIPTQPVVPPTIPNTGCQTITETIYDTVTSASGIKTQVPRKVTREVCNTTPTTPVTVPVPTPTVPTTPVVTVPSVPVTVPVNSIYNNGTYTGVGKYSFPGGSIDYTVEIIISGEKISNARFISFTPSGNGLYTRAQGDSILSKIVSSQNSSIDTFTGASGTSKAIQDAVDNALGKAKITSTTVSNIQKVSKISTKISLLNTLGNGLNESQKEILSKVIDTKFKNYTKIEKNNKLNEIISQNNKLIVNAIVLKSKTKNQDIITDLENKIKLYKDTNNVLKSKTIGGVSVNSTQKILTSSKISSYKALNGKNYKIIQNSGKVTIQKADGSFAKQSFTSYFEAVAYLNKNAIPVKKVVVSKPIPTKPKSIVVKAKKSNIKTVAIKPTKTIITPVVTKPVVKAPVVTKPIVDTTTKAS